MSRERIERIEAALRSALDPVQLQVVDESHRHRGHAGAADGRGHFRVSIVSARFTGCSRIERHRLVHAALDDQLATDIHALALEARTPEEWERVRRGG